jgi:hypothetical protein
MCFSVFLSRFTRGQVSRPMFTCETLLLLLYEEDGVTVGQRQGYYGPWCPNLRSRDLKLPPFNRREGVYSTDDQS